MLQKTNSPEEKLPYWRLSFFYFTYFALLGALAPYWGLYLKEQGFGAIAIGQLMAIFAGTKIIAPNLWGWLADKSNQRIRIVRLGALATIITFSLIFYSSQFWWVAMVMACFSFFWNAILPQIEVITLNHLSDPPATERYSLIRLWGSIGFIVTVIGGGFLFDRVSVTLLPWILLLLMVSIWLSSLLFKDKRVDLVAGHGPKLFTILKRKEVWVFFLTCFLMQVSHGPYYTFFSLFLEAEGYSRTAIGWLWALGVIAEVLVFLVMHLLMSQLGARRLVLLSLALGVFRWVVVGYCVDNIVLLVFTQCLHAATFGTFHAAAMHIVHGYFKGAYAGQGQALYSSISYGVGGAVGSLASGYLWDYFSPSITFAAASAVCLVAFFAAFFLLQLSSESV